jgi:hypothetical protein
MNSHLSEPMNAPDELRQLPIGTVFTHANSNTMPDSWVKVGGTRTGEPTIGRSFLRTTSRTGATLS